MKLCSVTLDRFVPKRTGAAKFSNDKALTTVIVSCYFPLPLTPLAYSRSATFEQTPSSPYSYLTTLVEQTITGSAS